MVDYCNECGGEMKRNGDYLVCQECSKSEGLQQDIELPKVKEYSKLRNRMPGRYFLSKFKEHTKETGFKIKTERKIREAYDYINELKGIAVTDLPEEGGEEIFKKLTERTRICYLLREYPTRKKKAVIWAFFIDLIGKELERLAPSISLESWKKEDVEKIEKYVKVLKRLKEIDLKNYSKAERIRDQITKENTSFNQKVLHKEEVRKGLKEIDSTYEKIFEEDFVQLLSRENVGNDAFIDLLITPIIMAGISSAESYIQNEIVLKKISEGKDINSLKKTGLVCVACYCFCELRNINVRPGREWAKFFGISPRTFKYLYQEIQPKIEIARKIIEKCKI